MLALTAASHWLYLHVRCPESLLNWLTWSGLKGFLNCILMREWIFKSCRYDYTFFSPAEAIVAEGFEVIPHQEPAEVAPASDSISSSAT